MFEFVCPACEKTRAPPPGTWKCTECGAPTVIRMDVSPSTPFPTSDEASLWRYRDLLPVGHREHEVSLGEGWTPLIEPRDWADELGVGRLLLKNETMNPTGAFKDRQVAVGLSMARQAGARAVAVVSSGNVAASAASYSAAAGIPCTVFTPSNAPDERLLQTRLFGARVYRVETLSSSRVLELVSGLCERRGWHLLSSAGLYNPFQVEGAKTIAYELVEQTRELPDWVVVPVGGGGLLGAVWRGFGELQRMGRCDRIPRLVGVQSDQCTPLVNAIRGGLGPREVIDNPVQVGDTIAGALADDILFDAWSALPAVRTTGGRALAVSDEEMLAAEGLLASRTGIFAEPASAATIAGLKRLVGEGEIGPGDSVCCVVTGSGFKDTRAAEGIAVRPGTVEPTEAAFRELA